MNLRKRKWKDSNKDVNTKNLEKRMKLKPVEEPPETNKNVSTEPSDLKNVKGATESISFVRRKCSVCTDMVARKTMKDLNVEDDKFVLAAIVSDRFVPIESIGQFLQKKRPQVCFEHIVEASTIIEKYIDDPKAIEKVLMPKIQSVNPNLSTTRKGSILTQFLFRNKKRRVKPTKEALNWCCVLCKGLQPWNKMSQFSSMNAKTVIMTGRVLSGVNTLEEAQQYITKRGKRICRTHLKKPYRSILSYLEVENWQELSNCSSDLIEKLMVTVNSLLPDMTIDHFKKSLHELAKKVEIIPTHSEAYACKKNFCSVCKTQESRIKLCQVKSAITKALIMVGCILKETHTIEDAQKMILLEKMEYICHKHFNETVGGICEHLAIGNIREIDDCSGDSMEKLMETLNAILPDMRVSQFKDTVHDLAKKAEKFEKLKSMTPQLPEAATVSAEELEPPQEEEDTATCGDLAKKAEKFEKQDATTPKVSEAVTELAEEDFEPPQKVESTIPQIPGAPTDSFGEHELPQKEEDTATAEKFEKQVPTTPKHSETVTELAEEDFELPQEVESTISQIPEPPTESVEEIKTSQEEEDTATCGVCQLQHPKDKFISVKTRTSKMMIMLGCVLRETHTIEEAEVFIMSGNKEFSCRKHFRKTKQKVLEYLEVQKASEISNCSKSSMKKLMITVNRLLPEMTVSEFESAVTRLSMKIEKFEEQKAMTPQLPEAATVSAEDLEPPQEEEDTVTCGDLAEKFEKQDATTPMHSEAVTEYVEEDFEPPQEVDSTIPQIPTAPSDFFVKHELPQKEKETTICGVCNLQYPKNNFIAVKSKSSKMMIMLGCVLRETHTIEKAEVFIMSGNKEFSCRKHFQTAMEKILEASEDSSCSDELMKKVMSTVNRLLPEMTVMEFKEAVGKLAGKVKKFEAEINLATEQ